MANPQADLDTALAKARALADDSKDRRVRRKATRIADRIEENSRVSRRDIWAAKTIVDIERRGRYKGYREQLLKDHGYFHDSGEASSLSKRISRAGQDLLDALTAVREQT